MQVKKDTLFSIQNEELKKERKYALLAMRLQFTFLCLCFLIALVSFIMELFSTNGFSSQPYLYLAYVLLIAGLVILQNLWRLQLWVYDILGILLFLNFLGVFHASNLLISGTILTWVVILFLPIVSAWRVRSFLRNQKYFFVDTINTMTLIELFKEKILNTKENTLFSIKKKTLKKKCMLSLFLLRIHFIVLFLSLLLLFGTIFNVYLRDLDYLFYMAVIPLFLIIGAFILWQLLQLNIWAYNTVGIASIFFLLNTDTYSEHFIMICLFLIFILLLSAWHVHLIAYKQARETTVQLGNQAVNDENREPASFIEDQTGKDSSGKVKKDTLFSISNEYLKKERKYSLLLLRVNFILSCAFPFLLIVSIFFLAFLLPEIFDTPFAFSTIAYSIVVAVSCLWMWKLQFLGCYIIGAIGLLLPLYNFIFLDTFFEEVALPLALQATFLITSWRVDSFLRKQAKESSTHEVKKTTDDFDQSPEYFI